MASRVETAGTCTSCNAGFSKRQMLRHLAECAYPDGKNVAAVVQLRVDAPGSPFWIDLDVKTTATLRDLDEFLRNIWLECCGHLSNFEIGDLRYSVDVSQGGFGREPDERSMDTRVSAALPPAGSTFRHEYDYGTTTLLRLKVVAQRHAPSRRNAVRLLARNEPPAWTCIECGATAAYLCAECLYEDPAFVCEEHVQDHGCGEEALLPVANSPRMGVCGYAGGA